MRSPAALRWGLWLVLVGLAAWYGIAMGGAPAAYRLVAWATIALSAILSLVVLVTETGRPRRPSSEQAGSTIAAVVPPGQW